VRMLSSSRPRRSKLSPSMTPTKIPRRPSHRPDIGMLTAWLKGPTEINLWHGVADQAQARDVNLFCFSGGIPHWPVEYEAQKNILFDIAGKQNVDGLLIWANILSHTLDRANLEAFCQRYAPLPTISMGMVLPSIPSIKIDMREGMRRLLSHLIETHGRDKIAFIRGSEVSQDAEDRYQAYCETLSQYGLPVDPVLIVPGDFRRNSGKAAIEELIDHRRAAFNAVVSANDNMAIGALQALQERGARVPDDVVVAGFDDIEETKAVTPTLTTVRCPWHMLGSKSVDLVLSRLSGEPLAEQLLLPTELVCRQSCGCQPLAYDDHTERSTRQPKTVSVIRTVAGVSAPRAVDEHTAQLGQIEEALLATGSVHGLDRAWRRQLVSEFIADARSGAEAPSRFIPTLLAALREISSGTEIIEWQDVLHAFRARIGILFSAQAEVLRAHELLEGGYAAIGEMAHRQQLNQRLEAIGRTDRLNRIVQSMSTTNDLETLMQLLALELPGLGIESCYLSLYDEKGESPAWSRLILACVGQERLPLDRAGIRYPTGQLVPAGMLPKNRRMSFDVEALYFKGEQIGLVMFEIGPRDGDVYTTLRGHLSSALKSAELIQVALDAETRAVKADQLKTHLLANVSHELRTPLNIILGLSQSALASPNPYEIELPGRLAQDLKYIFDCGEYLVRLVNDLLDMSRAEVGELDLCFEPVSPRALLKETFDSFRESSSSIPKDVALFLEIPEHLPILHADPIRLRQILNNLLSNAVKFTPAGSIHLGAEVQLPHLHLWVTDTGLGIPLDMQARIFEPFVKVDPPEKRRAGIGLGLSITRRLVALHGGSISLDSQPQRGTTFHVYLPLPGLEHASAKEADLQGAQPVLLWLSSSETPAPTVLSLCLKSGLDPRWLGNLEDVDHALQNGRPAALAWDLEHSRPGDWSIIQQLRRYPQFCQLPLLLYQENLGENISAGSRLTNIVLKPAGTHTLQHVLDLLPQALQRGEIWIVDDDPQALDYYQTLLGNFQADFVVRPIHGGAEALRLLATETPDLVVLDLMMPEVDGFEVLEQLRSRDKTKLIPVIVLTGKMLSYEDVKRLDSPRVFLQTKGVLSDLESSAEIGRSLTAPSALPQPTSLLVKQALASIQQNYTRALSLTELAWTVGVSKSYLSRIFKLETGISLWEYLNRFRILKAKEMLLLTDESITDIAAAVGYEDVGYFGRIFREIVNCSARTYRQKARATSVD
jgi:signal transduction histidine kinase/DNA-binding LacI/PurR family transcriptional regulator/AraC-like DNA-binding protein